MTTLTIYHDKNPDQPLLETTDADVIARELNAAGIRFERWEATQELSRDASSEEILAAYKPEIDRLCAEAGYETIDVIRMTPDNPQKDAFRTKFLDEHTHDEDEVRFFVEGSGAFYLHIGEKVYQVVCTRNDLMSVPAGTLHWFDMGPEPFFTAIRLFLSPDGWVAKFTGDEIAKSIPYYETPVH